MGALIVASLVSRNLTLGQVLLLIGALAGVVLVVVVLSNGNANWTWMALGVALLCIALGLMFAL